MKGYKGLIFLMLTCVCAASQAQYDGLVFRDHIYEANVKTPQLHLLGLPISLPIFELGTSVAMNFSFDDLDADGKIYTYELIHCDMFWNPSNLLFHEFATGFENEEIIEYSNSINTMIPFTNYQLRLPNRNTQLTKSGNYLLVIHEFDDPERPIISRRFVVIDPPVIGIKMIRTRPSNVSKMNTHQEIRFEIDTKELKIRNPKTEIVCVVQQNGRWDNALYNLRSRFERGPLLVFDYIDKIVFPAGKEFRSVDQRSVEYRGEGVFSLENAGGYIRSVNKLDKPRYNVPYFSKTDINGKFVISTVDYPNPEFYDLRCDYLETIFTLETGRKYKEGVYVFGSLTDWVLKDEFRMEYDEEYASYTTSAWLKQGFYDYIYVLANADGSADETTIEGHWFEATNDYTLIVYYRPYGARYDRAIGATTFEWGR